MVEGEDMMLAHAKPNILVVDNELEICHLFRDFFDFIGYNCAFDTDGERILRDLESLNYDLLFVDLKMGDTSGIDILRKSKKVHPLSEVIVVTGFGSEETVLKTLRYGAAAYIQKPISFSDIKVQAEQALSRQRFNGMTMRLEEALPEDADLHTHLQHIFDLDKLSRYLNLTIDLDMLGDTLLAGIAELISAEFYTFFLYDDVNRELVILSGNPVSTMDMKHLEGYIVAAFEKQANKNVGQPYHVRASHSSVVSEGPLREGLMEMTGIYVPIMIENSIRGMIGITTHTDQLADDTEDMLSLVSNRAAPVLTNATLHRDTKMLALTDGLTGLLNHRAFHERLNQEYERFRRYGSHLSLIVADYDNLKKFNDSYGHPAGDEVLRQVGEILRETSRETDVLARYGGDEFVILLPQTNARNAYNMAERIRLNIQESTIQVKDHDIRSSISLGIATVPTEAINSPREFLESADAALYEAKRAGKNRIVESGTVT